MERSSISCKIFQRWHPELDLLNLLSTKLLLLITDLSVRVDLYELRFLYNNNQVFRDKCQLFYSFNCRSNSYIYWPTIPTESSDMNCVSSARVNKYLEVNVVNWNNPVLAPKSCKKSTQNHFWQVFSFLTHFTICETFTSTGQPFCPNRLI